jgi:hypothetical protein
MVARLHGAAVRTSNTELGRVTFDDSYEKSFLGCSQSDPCNPEHSIRLRVLPSG